MTTPAIAAQRYLDAGLSVLPIRMDGSKAPMLSEWTALQEIRMTAADWPQSPCGIGIIGGKVSGNLEILDFDKPGAFEEWLAILPMAGDKLTELVMGLPVIETPDGGRHVYYRCAEIQSAQKLARAKAPYLGPHTGKSKTVLIETKGEGGYVVAPPSPAECHDAKKPYRQLSGPALTAIPKISVAQRQWLLQAARTFDEVRAAPETQQQPRQATGPRPGDEYNAKATWASILEPAGWVRLFDRGDVTYWRRPGKDGRGISATTGKCGDHLYVFSSNAPPFDPERAYDKFGAYCLLNHGGDLKAGARGLRPREEEPPAHGDDDAPADMWTATYPDHVGATPEDLEDGARQPGADDDRPEPKPNPMDRLKPITQAAAAAAWKTSGMRQCVPTGIADLDKAIGGGLPVGQITTLLGYTGTGKSEAARQIKNRCAASGHAVVHVDVELGATRIYERDLSQESQLPPGILNKGGFTDSQALAMHEADARIQGRKHVVTISPGGGIPLDLLTKGIDAALKSVATEKPTLLIVDSLQRLAAGAEGKDQRLQTQNFLWWMEAIARPRNVAMFVTCEQRRTPEGRQPGPAEALTSGAESRAIEFVSDVVLALVPKSNAADDTALASDLEDDREVQLLVCKNRHGGVGYLGTSLVFQSPCWGMKLETTDQGDIENKVSKILDDGAVHTIRTIRATLKRRHGAIKAALVEMERLGLVENVLEGGKDAGWCRPRKNSHLEQLSCFKTPANQAQVLSNDQEWGGCFPKPGNNPQKQTPRETTETPETRGTNGKQHQAINSSDAQILLNNSKACFPESTESGNNPKTTPLVSRSPLIREGREGNNPGTDTSKGIVIDRPADDDEGTL